ncbi:MAG: hypothetical protein LBH25_07715 [Fibromonadaceae bacterium]|nr:hypothetical protein [Fibromonadaceae bacterium]
MAVEFSTLLAMYILPILILFMFTELFAEEPSEADKRKDLLGSIQVSKVHSIDEVKGTYKSPRRAMFMSLLVPGSGQIYVGTKQSRYGRGVFYIGEEIALISGLYYHSIYKYDKQVSKYQNFAKKHFDVIRYEKNMNEIMNGILDGEYKDDFQKEYGMDREGYCKAIYGPNVGDNENCKSFSRGLDFAKGNYDPAKIYNAAAYYRTIASENFILGWSDIVPNPEKIIPIFTDPDEYHKPPKLDSSARYKEYMNMRKKANSLADRQAIFVGALILNHIVSAVDAALSAKAHNNSLYEEKISFLDKIRLGSDFHVGESFRAGAGLWYVF